jgi:hypothetical protein
MTTPNSGLIRLECPNCRGPLDQANATSQAIVCPKCNSYVSLGGETAEVLGKGRKLPAAPVPLALGDKGTVAGAEYVVLGRVMYRGQDDEETFTWNEWLLGAPDGRMLWLSLDETGFALFQKLRFRSEFDARTSTALDIGEGKKAFIHERYPAQVVGAEGELTWRAMPGERVFMAEGSGNGLKYSIQQNEQELEVHEGRAITGQALAEAFKKPEWIKKLKEADNARGMYSTIAALCIAAAIAAVFFAVIVSGSGTEDEPRTIELSSSGPSDSFTLDFTDARPVIVGLELIGGGMPENTFIDLDVGVVAPDGEEYDLFEQEIWHETGRDEDGAWRESQYKVSEMFVPTTSGQHTMTVSYDGSVMNSLTLRVTIRRNHIMPLWFICYSVVAGLFGVVAWFAGAAQKRT